MDLILSFLAKSLDKHGIILVHITYLPLLILKLKKIKLSEKTLIEKPKRLQEGGNALIGMVRFKKRIFLDEGS